MQKKWLKLEEWGTRKNDGGKQKAGESTKGHEVKPAVSPPSQISVQPGS